jgi:dipeptidyl aminopeptidase/acylaminoacyl peptidase
MQRDDRPRPLVKPVDRRAFIFAAAAGFVAPRLLPAQPAVTRPVVSEKACPLETITPVASDGHRGLAVLRKPPGAGPFPVVVWFHGGLMTFALERLQGKARDLATGPRFLAAGYVFVAPTYRSRDVDPQATDTVEDALATVEYLRKLPFIDRQSIVVGGCSGGGDLALQVAARTEVCAVVAEEPASVVTTGLFNKSLPKQGERYTPADAYFLSLDGRRYYTDELQQAFRAKAAKIRAPILIVQGDVDREEVRINRFNADVLIPELRALRKEVDVKSYPDQVHCFCDASGIPRRADGNFGRAPASWPAAALKAFEDIDAFCRRHVRTLPKALDPGLITLAPVERV